MLFPTRRNPAEYPWRLSLVTHTRFAEDLHQSAGAIAAQSSFRPSSEGKDVRVANTPITAELDSQCMCSSVTLLTRHLLL